MKNYLFDLSCQLVKALNLRWQDFCRPLRYCRILLFIDISLASLFSITFSLVEFLVYDIMLKITDFTAVYNEAIRA